jgi:pilus assembly protein CpaB
VPPDLLQVSVELSAERTIGGRLIPGDLVAVIASFDPFTLSGTDPLAESDDGVPIIPIPIDPETGEPDLEAILVVSTPHSTGILLDKILVTAVQYQSEEGRGTDAITPDGSVIVTLAASAEDAERIVFAIEHGRVWLARQDQAAPEPPTPVRTRLNIFR